MRRVAPALLLSAPAMAACLVLSACTGPSTPTSPTPPSASPAPTAPPGGQLMTTALAVESPHPAQLVAGSDGTTHLEYNLVITNAFTADATLTELVVRDESGGELHRLQGDALRAATFKLLNPEPSVTVPTSAAVEVIVDVPLPAQSGAAPATVDNQISYTLPDDAPFRTIIGATTVQARVPVDTSTPAVIKPPLRGPGWLNFNGCCLSSAPHRTVMLPADDGAYRAFEMFAIDWVKVSDGTVFRGDGSQLTDHHAYGSEIYAATAGEVVEVRNDLPNAPVNQSISGNATVKEPRDYPGNHVTVRFAPDRYAMYAHLQPGSVRVKPGDQVKEGDVLGLLGSSGNASAPHLHFSIQDGPDALTSDSLPFVIDGYQLTGTANIDPVSLTIDPATSPQTNTYPLTYSIVDFGT